jgi:hypothetical protein
LGPRIADLAARHVPTRDLVAVARPHLAELATAVGEVAGLSVPDGRVVHYVDQVGTAHEVQVRDWTGSRVPMHAVPSGQVMLAGLTPVALDRFLATPLESFTPATLTDATALRERLAQVTVDGYAWVRDEFSEGLASVAAPIRAPDGKCWPRSTSTDRRIASRRPALASASPNASSVPRPASRQISGRARDRFCADLAFGHGRDTPAVRQRGVGDCGRSAKRHGRRAGRPDPP